MLHVILGAGGSIANALTHLLLSKKEQVRLVSRSGFKLNGAEAVQCDVTNLADTVRATKDADVVHLCVGLKYDINVWKVLWPKIMLNTIEACKANHAKLIFFDNVYMYGKVSGKMTEATQYNPCSKKGEVRAQIARLLDQEYCKGDIMATALRAADLYGPHITGNSVPYFLAFEKMIKGKNAQWLINDNQAHSYTYTLDCAKAIYLISNDESAFNQTWHLPTCNPPITGVQFIAKIASELSMSPKHTLLRKWMLSLGGIFDRTIKEVLEMTYQYEHPYYFDSSKFETYFRFSPTPYDQGIKDTLIFLKG